MARKGDWIQTYTGRQFWPLDPRPEEVIIEDVAHALAMLCRFGGHCLRFYSVAEHSFHVSRLLPTEHALAGLLHDATEAYVADVPRPLKRFLPGYREAEAEVWRAIATRFGLDEALSSAVKEADERMLAAEAGQVMAPPPADWSLSADPAEVSVECFSPECAEVVFLEEFRRLWRARR